MARLHSLLLVACLLTSAMARGAAPAGGQAAPTAERGQAIYAARCAACHGERMEGIEDAPPLIGARFDSHWRGRPAALLDKIRRSMPQDDPGSLSPAEAEVIVAAILEANPAPAGR
ncbi:MAG: cytochrome c [Sphingomonas sp.]|uniref:c-type cytochrome n=1 Tax=Sphingomonas sp. TaxID=28214 RepID=UPI001B088B3A|nr:cytochrome c [Sphingomonas sp.]MBO9621639.1 cytochrome c [Sphingomonas sp.]